jgi:hypothetical protein
MYMKPSPFFQSLGTWQTFAEKNLLRMHQPKKVYIGLNTLHRQQKNIDLSITKMGNLSHV